MQSYRRLERTVVALLSCYVIMSFAIEFRIAGAGHDKVFPLSAWSLFAKVRSRMSDYQVRVLELDGERLDPPRFSDECPDRLPALATLDAQELIGTLAHAVIAGDRTTERRARRVLEGVYFNDVGHLRYELVHRTYNPLDRWQHGTFLAIEPIRQFDSRSDQ